MKKLTVILHKGYLFLYNLLFKKSHLRIKVNKVFFFLFYLGRGSWGKVLAVRWQMGELERNFMTMQTSSGEELNIIGERCMAELTQKYINKF